MDKIYFAYFRVFYRLLLSSGMIFLMVYTMFNQIYEDNLERYYYKNGANIFGLTVDMSDYCSRIITNTTIHCHSPRECSSNMCEMYNRYLMIDYVGINYRGNCSISYNSYDNEDINRWFMVSILDIIIVLFTFPFVHLQIVVSDFSKALHKLFVIILMYFMRAPIIVFYVYIMIYSFEYHNKTELIVNIIWGIIYHIDLIDYGLL